MAGAIKILEVQIPENRHQPRLGTEHVPEHRRFLHTPRFHAWRNLHNHIKVRILGELVLFRLRLRVAVTIADWWADLHSLRLAMLTENACDATGCPIDRG